MITMVCYECGHDLVRIEKHNGRLEFFCDNCKLIDDIDKMVEKESWQPPVHEKSRWYKMTIHEVK